jgi:hypothetical protein
VHLGQRVGTRVGIAPQGRMGRIWWLAKRLRLCSRCFRIETGTWGSPEAACRQRSLLADRGPSKPAAPRFARAPTQPDRKPMGWIVIVAALLLACQ